MKSDTPQGRPAELKPLEYVDLFLGCETTKLPEPEGIVKRWEWLKAQVGNTHPGACYPYGMVSVCPYSGGYPTGYGLNQPSSHGKPSQFHNDYCASGFTHFQQSGSGAIGIYYNYFKVIPLAGGLDQVGKRWPLENEKASPGYYSAELGGTGIKAELTVGPKYAVHRYTFPASKSARIAVDLAAGGLDVWPDQGHLTDIECRVTSNNAAEGFIIADRLPIYFHLEIDAPDWDAAVFTGNKALSGEKTLAKRDIPKGAHEPLGVVFSGTTKENGRVVVKIGFSLKGVAQARANLAKSGSKNFNEVIRDTADVWDNYLSRIRVEGGTDDERTIFYTSLYHSLIKPCDFGGESPRRDGDAPLYLDMATMWDMYKTALPLMIAVYPERGRDFVNALLNIAEDYGEFPIACLMDGDFVSAKCKDQACDLAHTAIADAYVKGITGIDWTRAKKLMAESFERDRGKMFVETGKGERITHVLDNAYGAFCTAQLAKGQGDEPLYKKMMALADYWRKAYDPEIARLPIDGRYYEGKSWNYSFRLMHDMAGRIGLYKSEADFIKDLDAFFGFIDPPENAGFHGWEGLNNEPDMEVPYAYIYAGRQDRTAKIVRECMKYQYTTGRGGLPGNDDSGGTSSWYVWSAIGIFPAAGQDIFLIGSPIFTRTTINIDGKEFIIEANNVSDKNIYIQSATLNGNPLDRAYLHFSEMKSGGKLVLEMGPEPSGWASDSRPPSYSVGE